MPRVDARDKVMGRAKYAADLCDRNVLTAKILHAEHAHALVKSINVERARAMEGVEAVFTCLTSPKTISRPPAILVHGTRAPGRGGQAAAHGPRPFLGRRRCCCSRAG